MLLLIIAPVECGKRGIRGNEKMVGGDNDLTDTGRGSGNNPILIRFSNRLLTCSSARNCMVVYPMPVLTRAVSTAWQEVWN